VDGIRGEAASGAKLAGRETADITQASKARQHSSRNTQKDARRSAQREPIRKTEKSSHELAKPRSGKTKSRRGNQSAGGQTPAWGSPARYGAKLAV
jgi:hypothetical protein